ncbi:MAG TPA: glycosyltransferase family 4 protein [Gammaproteobacteria bacterium]|nr:glycosyltransferase family 4 protein [Gammaproteobacteria bacterium]
MNATLNVTAPCLALLVTLGVCRWLVRQAGRWAILDHPGERSLHHMPVPRTGGVAIVFGIATACVLLVAWDLMPDEAVRLAPAALPVTLVSFADDLRGVRAGVRLAVHFGAAGALLVLGFLPERLALPGFEVPLGTLGGWLFGMLWLAWMTNLYNFMDGIDGLAGGMAVIGFGALAVLGWLAGAYGYAVVCLVIAAAAGGFLVFNFPPARMFMGDTGSATLGFLAGGAVLWGDTRGLYPLWLGVLVFSPFIVDATVTLLRRALAGEKVWLPHRGHFYQRLVQAGWSHRQTVCAEYFLMLGCALSVIFLSITRRDAIDAACAAGWIVLYAALAGAIDRLAAKQRWGTGVRSHD